VRDFLQHARDRVEFQCVQYDLPVSFGRRRHARLIGGVRVAIQLRCVLTAFRADTRPGVTASSCLTCSFTRTSTGGTLAPVRLRAWRWSRQDSENCCQSQCAIEMQGRDLDPPPSVASVQWLRLPDSF
jgi:hypothetical protein